MPMPARRIPREKPDGYGECRNYEMPKITIFKEYFFTLCSLCAELFLFRRSTKNEKMVGAFHRFNDS